MNEVKRKKLGIALSGAAARSAFYVGFLEVLKEKEVPVDFIAAQSGATIAAAGFACNSLEQVKEDLFSLTRKKLVEEFATRSQDGGGIYSLDKAEEYGRSRWTHGAKFEEVVPKLCFVATDLDSGLPVRLEMGDIARAGRISCTVPGLFEPVVWGSKHLVDGGLSSYIPGNFVRDSGADIVVGVSVRAREFIFPRPWMMLRSCYNWVKRFVFPASFEAYISRQLNWLQSIIYLDLWDDSVDNDRPKMTAPQVLNRAVDIAIASEKKYQEEGAKHGCDLLIREGDGNFGGSIKVGDIKKLYEDGRMAAEKYLPEILKLIEINKTI